MSQKLNSKEIDERNLKGLSEWDWIPLFSLYALVIKYPESPEGTCTASEKYSISHL